MKIDICVDRLCTQNLSGPHYTPTNLSAINDPRVNWNLEKLKEERGRRCWSCRRFLLYTDEDHSYCNECWDIIMTHTFVSEEDELDISSPCANCGEEYDNKVHITIPLIGKCANCSGPIREGEGAQGVHYTCWNEYAKFLNEPENYDDIEL